MKIPATAREAFDVVLPELLREKPAKAREIGAVYGFSITGTNDGGKWVVDLAANPPKVTSDPAGDFSNVQCTFQIGADDFLAVMRNPAMAMQLYFQGKLRVTGDPMLATKLQKLFTL